MTRSAGVRRSIRRSVRSVVRRVPVLDRAVRTLRQTDLIAELQNRMSGAIHESGDRPSTRSTLVIPPSTVPFLDWVPAGHFYSAVPDLAELDRDAERIFARPVELPGIDLREEHQLTLFAELARLARDAPLPHEAGRRFAENDSYGIGDAMTLQSMLRLLEPKRYIEVGSGWTTALAADTNDGWLGGSMKITAVEPHADLVRGLVAGTDLDVIEEPVQDVPLDLYGELRAGDVLFIDCSHVVKVGSDAHHLVTRVLPVLNPGVWVHLHDMFWPFEYPRTWIREGRAWNEQYLLHAFLLFNPVFSIQLFNAWLAEFHRDEIERQLPAMLENPGGALWLRVDKETSP